MSKTQQRERSTLTNDQINQLEEADSIVSRMLAEVQMMEKQFEVGLISREKILDALNTRIRTNYDRYNDLVHDVELSHGTSIYFLGYQEMCLKEWELMTAITKML
jgi:hypothetical protein